MRKTNNRIQFVHILFADQIHHIYDNFIKFLVLKMIQLMTYFQYSSIVALEIGKGNSFNKQMIYTISLQLLTTIQRVRCAHFR